MSTNNLTAAEKRKITLAAKAERGRQEQAAFIAESKVAVGRKAKADANKNAIWKVDQSASRKRALSTAQASETVKKARGTKTASVNEEAAPEVPAAKAKASGRKYVPATIEDSDESAPETKKPVHIDFTKLVPHEAKSARTKVKAVVTKGLKVLSRAKATKTSKETTVTKTVPAGPARVVAESASEEGAVSSEENSDKVNTDQSDDEESVSANEDEFRAEVPHVVLKKAQVAQAESADDSDRDIDMNAKGKVPVHGSAKDLFESDKESIEIDKPRNKGKSRQENFEPESDDTFSDAPKRVAINISDIDMSDPEPVGKRRASVHSRRSSVASWSSGQDLRVPDSDADDDVESYSKPPMKKGKSACRPLRTYGGDDMRLHEAIARGLTTVPLDGVSLDGAPLDDHSRRSSTASLYVMYDPAAEDVNPVPKKARKVSTVRQKQAELERPEVRPVQPAPRQLSKGLMTQLDRIAAGTIDAASHDESSWHISARIMFPAAGKDIGLILQLAETRRDSQWTTGSRQELKVVLRGCIKFIKLSLLFEDAYPAIVSRAGFARSFLLSAVQAPEAIYIKKRLESDLTFASRLADIRFGGQEAPGLYNFASLPASQVKTIVNDLLQDHRYIFPVDPMTSRLKVELPFQHEAIVRVLKKAVFTGPFKTKNLHLFASTSEKHPKRLELPDAMVCLAATAVYGALVEYRATGTQQNIPFTEGAYEDIYRNHMRTLADTRAAAPNALHRVLHTLYNLVTDTTSSTSNAAGSSSILINLVEVPDSD
ncbi:hypothetical protein MVEN_00099000 [Mycena venus]|uniref:DUF6532 domain-containing protein n=1 Tax=Mycena venus TaxID=2733690 RepID=A0A8H7DIC0_9AGAR|nr:hypothetical protein MVEN_00099000 [Mycena venus]